MTLQITQHPNGHLELTTPQGRLLIWSPWNPPTIPAHRQVASFTTPQTLLVLAGEVTTQTLQPRLDDDGDYIDVTSHRCSFGDAAAVIFTPRGGRVTIAAEQLHSHSAIFAVALDVPTGRGVAAVYRDRLCALSAEAKKPARGVLKAAVELAMSAARLRLEDFLVKAAA